MAYRAATGGMRRDRRTIVDAVQGGLAGAHATAIAVQILVATLERMRGLLADPAFIPLCAKLAEAVQHHGSKFIIQLSHSGRQMDLPEVTNQGRLALSPTNASEPLHGFPTRARTAGEICHLVGQFAHAARRAKAAGNDGVELHASNGYLFDHHFFRNPLLRPLFRAVWNRLAKGHPIEGVSLGDARLFKQAVTIPMIVTGGFQAASVVRAAIAVGTCDGVAIARPLIANNDLLDHWRRSSGRPDRPCTYCN